MAIPTALHTFQVFGNSEKPPRNKGLRGSPLGPSDSAVRAARLCKEETD
jgi:hypothetical protein